MTRQELDQHSINEYLEPVGEVILYTGEGFPCAPFKQVKWVRGVIPEEGTKLYAVKKGTHD